MSDGKKIIKAEKAIDKAVQDADKAIEAAVPKFEEKVAKTAKKLSTAAEDVAKAANKAAKALDEDINKIVSFEETAIAAVKAEIAKTKNLFSKFMLWFNGVEMKRLIKELSEMEQRIIKAGGSVKESFNKEVVDLETLAKKYEGKVISFEKKAVAEFEKGWNEALAELKHLTK